MQCQGFFCLRESGLHRRELYGITDGKAVGTFVESLFKEYLSKDYDFDGGNTAKGLDLPSVNTDIKVTSSRQPQSSCPYRDSRQKIYGLGYNLIIFVYEKEDDDVAKDSVMYYLSCTFVASERTADYQTTTGLQAVLDNHGNEEDVFAFLSDHHIPGDEVALTQLSRDILASPPSIGYLTVSNALQWRLQYGRVVALQEEVEGIHPIIRYDSKRLR